MSRTPDGGGRSATRRAIHRTITTLEPRPTAATIRLAPSAPDVSPARDAVPLRRTESDPAVMLGLVTLVVACSLFAAVGAALLWLV
jgi:hypothetical protein